MNIICKSNLSTRLKRKLFKAAVKHVHVYGCITWILTTSLEKNIDGTYTRMLRAVTNKSRRDHLTNEQLVAIYIWRHSKNYQINMHAKAEVRRSMLEKQR